MVEITVKLKKKPAGKTVKIFKNDVKTITIEKKARKIIKFKKLSGKTFKIEKNIKRNLKFKKLWKSHKRM